MRVVSQNRMWSVDFDRTVFWRQYNNIYAKINAENICFGQYQTDERAAEVFEDMHKAYAPVYSISDGLTEEQVAGMFIQSNNIVARNILNSGSNMCITTYDDYVYYMPKEQSE